MNQFNNTLKDKIKASLNIVDLAKILNYKITKNNKITSIYNPTEKTPSLVLYSQTNSFYCFSTGRGGDLFDFYMDSQGVDFKTALNELKKLTGIEKSGSENVLNKTNPRQRQPKQAIENKKEVIKSKYNLNDYKAVFRAFLDLLSLDSKGKDYLLNRGFDFGFLDGFKFKYFEKKNYFKISSELKARFDLDLLKEAGLFNSKGNLLCYCDCVVIPYLDRDLEPIYLQFRNLEAEAKLKYLWLANSKIEKPIYFLDLVLDSLENHFLAYKTRLWITEGVFDALIVNQNLFVDSQNNANVGLALGSSCDTKKLEPLFDLLVAKNETGFMLDIILAFDSDRAGLKASKEAFNILSKYKYKDKIRAFEIDLKRHKDLNDFVLEY